MANEFRHGTVGTELAQAEYELITGHSFDAQATGDVLYALSATQLSRLAIGSTNAFLRVIGGIPAWETSPTFDGDAIFAASAVRWSSGVAVVAAEYSIQRDADGTNQLHLNVPTGASFELSVNDTAELTLSATDLDLQSNTLSNVAAAGNDWTEFLLTLSSARAGDLIGANLINTDNTNAASGTRLLLQSGGTSAGDPFIRLTIVSGETIALGLDNSVSDDFTISNNATLGTNDRLRLVTTTGVLSIDGAGAGDGLPTLFDEYDDAIELRGFQKANVPNCLLTYDQQYENQQHLADIGVAEWAIQDDGSYRWMMRVQPMFRLLAGGVYQNRQLIDGSYEKLSTRVEQLEKDNRQLKSLVEGKEV